MLKCPGSPWLATTCFPLHKAKAVQAKGQDREKHLLPTDAFPSLAALCLRQRAWGSRLSTVKAEGRGKMHPVTSCTQPHPRHWAHSGPGALVQWVQCSRGPVEQGRGRRWRQQGAPPCTPTCPYPTLQGGQAGPRHGPRGRRDEWRVRQRVRVLHCVPRKATQHSARTQTSADLSRYIYTMQWLMVWNS